MAVRAWKAGDREVHHILDPRTGDAAAPYWVLVSATGASCVDHEPRHDRRHRLGHDALDRLAAFDQCMHSVRADGEVFSVNGWPTGQAA